MRLLPALQSIPLAFAEVPLCSEDIAGILIGSGNFEPVEMLVFGKI
jgi:hypothetical protein